jgi:hypothetical protein
VENLGNKVLFYCIDIVSCGIQVVCLAIACCQFSKLDQATQSLSERAQLKRQGLF